MFGFNFGKNYFLGIDIGGSSIKMAEVKIVDGKPFLFNYAWAPLGEDGLSRNDSGASSMDLMMPEYIKRVFKKASFKSRNAYVSVPAFGGLITTIDFPEMMEADMEQAIRFEAHKYIPSSLDDVVLSWDIIGKTSSDETLEDGKKKGKVQVLLVAAAKSRVLRYENFIKMANLDLKSIDIEVFPMVRSLIGNDPGTFFIVDIGDRACNIILVEKGIVKVNRNIDAGGRDITKAIIKGMNISWDRAEALKVSGKNFFEKESSMKFIVLDLIAGEVERISASYYKGNQKKIDGLVLSGGTARLVGITDYFSKKLGIQTVVGNPFRRLNYHPSLEPLMDDLKTQFSVCVGLALKGADEYLMKK